LHSEGLKNKNQTKYHDIFKPVSALKPEHKDKAQLKSFSSFPDSVLEASCTEKDGTSLLKLKGLPTLV